MRRLASAVVLLVVASACSSGGGHRGDASTDAIIDVSSLQWPDGCPSGVSNDKGVGAPCTRGGGQCKSPLLCTCDPLLGAQLVGAPCFCTLAAFAQNGSKDPCKDSVPDPANYCGSGATCCDVLTSGAYCTPNVCLINHACLIFVPRDGGT
jgi:hypothetical protein